MGHQASGVVSSAHATKSERMTTGVGNSMPLATGFLPAPCWPSTPTQQAQRLDKVGLPCYLRWWMHTCEAAGQLVCSPATVPAAAQTAQ